MYFYWTFLTILICIIINVMRMILPMNLNIEILYYMNYKINLLSSVSLPPPPFPTHKHTCIKYWTSLKICIDMEFLKFLYSNFFLI